MVLMFASSLENPRNVIIKGNNLRHSIDVVNTLCGAIFDLQGQFSPS